MGNNELAFRTVSQCSTADWCRGYNEAVKEANAVIERLEAENKNLKQEIDVLQDREIELENQVEELVHGLTTTQELIEIVKTKAVKEFFEKMIEHRFPLYVLDEANSILKEMTSQSEEDKSLDAVIDSCEEMNKTNGPRQMGEKMICKECGSSMHLDDKDYNFKGNYDNYWICENDDCLTSCIEQVRFGQSFKEEWHSENNGEVKDYVVKHNIQRPKNKQDKPLDTVIRSCEVASKNGESRSAGKSIIDKGR